MKKSLVSLLLVLGTTSVGYAQDDFVCGTDERHFSVVEAAVAAWNAENGIARGGKSDAPTIVPIVVGYDDAALSQEGSEVALRNWVEGAIALLNTGLTASEAPAQVLLVGLELVPHGLSLTPTASSRTALLQWAIGSPELAEIRDENGGKIVFYLTGMNIGGGAAGGLISVGQMGRAIIAHEVGHSFGLHHDQFEDSGCAPACGHTFRDESGVWQVDIMAYSPCNTLGLDPATCREAQRDGFSNPEVLYEGVPTGIKNVADAARIVAENAPAIAAGLSPGECRDYEENVCLQGRRFLVSAFWRTADGSNGFGKAVRLTEDTGYFSFFADANVEPTVKVLNGCGLNNKFWVFAAGMTNVEVVWGVTDTKTGITVSYHNPLNKTFVTRTDTGAFDCTF